MKRKITVTAPGVSITATIDPIAAAKILTRDETEYVRDVLADRLQEAAARLPYMGVARSRVEVT